MQRAPWSGLSGLGVRDLVCCNGCLSPESGALQLGALLLLGFLLRMSLFSCTAGSVPACAVPRGKACRCRRGGLGAGKIIGSAGLDDCLLRRNCLPSFPLHPLALPQIPSVVRPAAGLRYLLAGKPNRGGLLLQARCCRLTLGFGTAFLPLYFPPCLRPFCSAGKPNRGGLLLQARCCRLILGFGTAFLPLYLPLYLPPCLRPFCSAGSGFDSCHWILRSGRHRRRDGRRVSGAPCGSGFPGTGR